MSPPEEAEAGARGRGRAVGGGGDGGRGRAWELTTQKARGGKKLSVCIEMSQDYAQEQFKLYW